MIRQSLLFTLVISCAQQSKLNMDSAEINDETTDVDGDGFVGEDDCDDNNSSINPNSPEICDGIDNNCDGEIDEEVTSTFYFDGDGDGFGSDDDTQERCSSSEEYVDSGGDCDDQNNTVYPSAPEQCDEIDNDCNGVVDDDLTTQWFADADADGFGNAEDVLESCIQPDGYVEDSSDCDDMEALVNPQAEEVCDELDNNCNDEVDEDVNSTFYLDSDADGFGSNSSTMEGCTPPEGYSEFGGDCDDFDSWTNPGTEEYCHDYVDNNCDGFVDDASSVDALLWFADVDEDGFGDNNATMRSCYQPSGYTSDNQDCNDSEASIYPNSLELCDGQINDCQTTTLPTNESDDDGDGYVECAIDSNGWNGSSGVIGGNDCDDIEATKYLGAPELCDGQINDCQTTELPVDEIDDDEDGYVECTIDSNGWDGDSGVIGGEDCDDTLGAYHVSVLWYLDQDEDGQGDPTQSLLSCDAPSGYVLNSDDCNDSEASIFLGAPELCDGLTNDCQTTALPSNESDDDGDGYVECEIDTDGWDGDSGVIGGDDCDDADTTVYTPQTWYVDSDADGFGDPNNLQSACNQPGGSTLVAGDCNDSNGSINPNATETCNTIDDNCDGQTDEGVQTTYYRDIDGDGYGNSADTTLACAVPSGYTANNTDCDDTLVLVYPGASESCNSIDDDCDGQTDENVQTTYYQDSDNDGFGNSSSTTLSCSVPNGYTTNNTDCNDNSGSVFPGANESCNSVDDDCDGQTDENVQITYYQDSDNDGYGNIASTTQACSAPSGYVSNTTDCDDGAGSVYPGASESCNSIDDDCDGTIDENVKNTYYRDVDGDGYGNSANTTLSCSAPSGYVSNADDCNDGAGSVYPGASESCNSVDDDCDGQTDENVKNTYYLDSDNDGYGQSNSTTQSCSMPSGYASSSGDCNDSSSAVYPGASESCNSVDDDCDGSVDENVQTTYYLDSDNDGYGQSNSSTASCSQPSGYASSSGDCNDSSSAIYPGAPEQCNLTDNDCDGSLDEGASCRVHIKRYFSIYGGHFYTSNPSEAAIYGYSPSSSSFYLYNTHVSGTSPFYRCLNTYWLSTFGQYRFFYTTSPTCENSGALVQQGVIGYIANSNISGTTTLWRLYNSASSDHLFTTDYQDRLNAQAGGYVYEGVPGYVWTSSN